MVVCLPGATWPTWKTLIRPVRRRDAGATKTTLAKLNCGDKFVRGQPIRHPWAAGRNGQLVETTNRNISKAFRPRARLLQLLGDQLIGSPRLAVFELVKNAYDADADEVDVIFDGLGGRSPTISVRDNGAGMSFDTLEQVWLVPGDDHREIARGHLQRSPKYGRLPLGEKGVGRFAVHKLGDRIRLVTRAAGQAECLVDLDWRTLLEHRYLEEAEVAVTERDPVVFTGEATGTLIEISELRDANWDRREIRELYRHVTSIASPFGDRMDNFDVRMKVPGHSDWISTLPSVSQLLEFAPFYFEFDFDGSEITYSYEFKGIPGIKVEKRSLTKADPYFQIAAEDVVEDLDPTSEPEPRKSNRGRQKVTADAEILNGIGPVKGKFYIFDRDKNILSKYGETRFLERYLDQNGGVRVYRDNIRVYNYGEPRNDWLGLDLRRVNEPTKNLSRNIVVGVVDLDLDTSPDLREKTNREGFVENDAYYRLRRVVMGALSLLETERGIDKRRIREATGKAGGEPKGVEKPLAELRKLAAKHEVLEVFEPSIRKIEQDYGNLRENFLRSGVSQVGLAIVFHEIERGISVLARSMEDPKVTMDFVRKQTGQLQAVLETSTQLLKKSEKKPGSLRGVVRAARDLSLLRLRLHKIKLTAPVLEEGAPDATPVFASSLVLGAITNVLDNAVHWMKVRYAPEGPEAAERKLFVNVLPDYPAGPAIIIADNGPGFSDSPEEIVRPFFTRRPGGSGLGLYFANMVMDLNEGKLMFPTAEEADVPEEFDGAVVALVFGKS
jgi:signal transduction histidine kinase